MQHWVKDKHLRKGVFDTYHSIKFGNLSNNTWKDTYDDWHLAPSSRPVINPPAQKVKTLDIPGGDGLIDLSTSLTGYPVYQNRTGSIEFIVLNDFRPWQIAYSDIMGYLHGKTMQAILEDDPGYYYEGRFTVNSWKSEKNWSKITIDYSVGPYKWSLQDSTDDWLWDPFSFIDGVIRPSFFNGIVVSTTAKELTFVPDEEDTVHTAVEATDYAPVKPEFIVSENLQGQLVVPDVTLMITKSDSTTERKTLLGGETTSIAGLLLWNGKWMYDGKPVTVSVDTMSGTAKLAVRFRPGRL